MAEQVIERAVLEYDYYHVLDRRISGDIGVTSAKRIP
jgi:hypothetical protein